MNENVKYTIYVLNDQLYKVKKITKQYLLNAD